MRIILTSNVPKLGQVGDVCTVKPGYGRNYLLPRGLAILAAPGALKQIDDMKRTENRRQDKIRYEMMDLAKRISNQHLHVQAKVGETGRLYGSITASHIADLLEARVGEPIDRRKVMLDESIRTLGDHDVHIHLMPGVDATVKLTVEDEEGQTAHATHAAEPSVIAELSSVDEPEAATADRDEEAEG